MRPADLAVWILGAPILAGLVFLACDDEHRRTPYGQVASGSGVCEAKPGELPAPDCDSSSKTCREGPGCAIDETRCGSTSTCLPIGQNAGKDVVDLRFRRLNIAAPATLSAPLIQSAIINNGMDLAERSCGENGQGLFSWILRVDRRSGTLVTGGAPPSADPFGVGFCFARFTLGATRVEPLTVPIAFEGNTFRITERAAVNIPIFLTDQLASAIILPIRDARIEGVTLSAEGNCIGAFQRQALDPSCTEDRDLCPKWTTAGALGGAITLEDADVVKIRDLNNKSLCAFLSGDASVCTRDASGKIVYRGDYCAATRSPGACGDAVWLAATFAASAAKIFDGRGTVDGCSGVTTETDAGAADATIQDAATDGP